MKAGINVKRPVILDIRHPFVKMFLEHTHLYQFRPRTTPALTILGRLLSLPAIPVKRSDNFSSLDLLPALSMLR